MFLGSCAAVSLISACPAVTFAVLSAGNALNPQFFSRQALMHMRTAAAVCGVLAALALTVALVATIADHVSKRDSQSKETTIELLSGSPQVNPFGSINW